MVAKVTPITGTKTLAEIQVELEGELAIRNAEMHIVEQVRIAGYWDSPWGVSISGLSKPTRWQRYWHRKLLGWTWRDM